MGEDRGGGQEGATARRASIPDDGRRRWRASGSAEAGGAEIIMVELRVELRP